METLCLLLSLRLTLTELPVLGDHLAVAAVALAGVGAVAVYTAALPFAWVLVTLVHICNQRQKKKIKAEDREGEEKRLNTTVHRSSISPAEIVHLPTPLLHSHSPVMGLSPAEAEQKLRPRPSP